MTWRLAKSLETLRTEINTLSPNRNRVSDGTIGDEKHASRSSDHNPWVKDGKMGVVTAIDITHDPDQDDVNGNEIAEALRLSGDKRIKYIIWNKKIWNPSIAAHWRNYTGSNPHDKHIHISVSSTKSLYDNTGTWNLGPIITPVKKGEAAPLIPRTIAKSATAPKVYVYIMYGLGGRMWSSGMEDILAKGLRQLPNVICPPTRGYGEWESIVEEIKKQPEGSKTVVIGHSMGAATATYVTDYVKVDLLVCYDLAGKVPSNIGKNTGHAIDIYDTIWDLVPEWRLQANKGHEGKIDLWYSNYGHTNQDDSEYLLKRIIAEVNEL